MVKQAAFSARVYHVTSYGADPTGKRDSTEAVLRAISDAVQGSSEGLLMEGIKNLGGAQVNLEGGNYLISRPLRLPATGLGNLMVHMFTFLHAHINYEKLLFLLFSMHNIYTFI